MFSANWSTSRLDAGRLPTNPKTIFPHRLVLVILLSFSLQFSSKRSNSSTMSEYETSRGVNVRDVSAADFIKAYADHLKRSGKMELPSWSDVVKTASFKEHSPYDPDWYYIRAASIARKVYLRQHTGVGSLRKVYGGGASRGVKRKHFQKASGGLIRHILHQLEEMKVVEKCAEGVNKGGRRISSHGQQDLDRIAGQVVKCN
uniref:40S ribosomal protein S193 putative n=1 Tax=Albugo laibachii Nc14 TaxID=890382 RepID=F0WMY7_9STRA|nr:40S ribosomal protein S193 putative [Albugo laibachii Nc14]|eukprot:CCA22674.1 40S ribosomal protein S193 putative [Albugo laibachii Nc14]